MSTAQHTLTPLFEPGSIAIVGASETPSSIGNTLTRNMLDSGYQGNLFLVNPRHRTVFGRPCYPSVDKIPQRLDLAVICTKAETAPAIIEACGRAGTHSAIIIAGGFSESGAALQGATLAQARRLGVRLLGPDSLGIMRPDLGVNLAYANSSAHSGSIGLISQSGALCAALLDWALPNKVGFSSVVSLGASSDVDLGEILDYFVADPKTENIFLYIESIKNARRFMSALRAAARCKPVLLIKVGCKPGVTDVPVCADDVFDAALRRAGVVRLDNVGQMQATAQALYADFRPRGNRLAIIANGSGAGVMAADHAAHLGIPLARLNPATWPGANPLDILGDADPARYAAVLAACQEDPQVDGILAILAPQALSDPTQTARAVVELARHSDKPLATCWMGEQQVGEARLLFKGAGIPSFHTPEPAVDLFSKIGNYYRNQKLLMQTPASLSEQLAPNLESARLLIETALQEGRQVLSETESKALLAAFHIPVARSVAETGRALRIGILQDAIFGPAIALCSGGGEFDNADRSVALPPLNRVLIADMLHSTQARPGALRNLSPADMEAIQAVLLRVSEMVCELSWLRTLDINPLIVDQNGATAVDVRISIDRLPPGAGRYDHMAIHPYPSHLATGYRSDDGQTVAIRPIRPEDAEMEQAFVHGLSAESRYFRFMNTLRELSQGLLIRLTQIDYDREMAFVATVQQDGRELEVGVARYATNPDGESCEFAIVVADAWQGKGLARRLMNVLIEAARSHGGLKQMHGEFLADNQRMLKFVTSLGFVLTNHPEDASLRRGILVLN